MFSELGFSELVRQARGGARRADLARAVPVELLEHVCALGSRKSVIARVDAYYTVGADTVAVVPSTAEDPSGAAALRAVAEGFRLSARPKPASADPCSRPVLDSTGPPDKLRELREMGGLTLPDFSDPTRESS